MKRLVVSLSLLGGLLLASPARPQGAMDNPHASPHGDARPNTEEPALDLPHDSIEVALVDGNDAPIAGHDVRLGILFQKIAEGESRTSRTQKTGTDGKTRFDGLETGSNYAYRVTARSGPAEYASTPFNLRDHGMRVTLHVYPVTTDPAQAIVGMRGFFYIETRDDVFQIETLFRVINLGKAAWVPKDVIMSLPSDFKAFNAGESMFDARFEAVDGRGARLVGTFPPGQQDVSFRFQVPKPDSTSMTFSVRPPARTAEMRVIAVANKNMGLEVDGFEPPREGTGPSGDHVLVTRRLVGRGEPEVGAFTIVLTGLPTPDEGRWVAVAIALAFGVAGGLAAAGKLKIAPTERHLGDRARARDLLFSELVVLAKARHRGEIGPTAYDRAHRSLVDAIARIGVQQDKKRGRRARTATARAEKASSTPSG